MYTFMDTPWASNHIAIHGILWTVILFFLLLCNVSSLKLLTYAMTSPGLSTDLLYESKIVPEGDRCTWIPSGLVAGSFIQILQVYYACMWYTYVAFEGKKWSAILLHNRKLLSQPRKNESPTSTCRFVELAREVG